MSKHIQCLMRRDKTHQVAWIPASLAVADTFVELFDDILNDWVDGWKVVEVYSGTALDSTWVRERSRDYKHQREVSDI